MSSQICRSASRAAKSLLSKHTSRTFSDLCRLIATGWRDHTRMIIPEGYPIGRLPYLSSVQRRDGLCRFHVLRGRCYTVVDIPEGPYQTCNTGMSIPKGSS